MPRIKDLVQYFTAQQSKLICDFLGGWEEPDEIWSYSSSTQITVPTGASSRFAVGDRIRFKQGGSYKYYVVYGIPSATTVNISGGTDYTVANSAITDIGVSRHPAPIGFPSYFNYQPTLTTQAGGLANTTRLYAYFNLIGKQCMHLVGFNSDQTVANSLYWEYDLPFTEASQQRIFCEGAPNGATAFMVNLIAGATSGKGAFTPTVVTFTVGANRAAFTAGVFLIA